MKEIYKKGYQYGEKVCRKAKDYYPLRLIKIGYLFLLLVSCKMSN